MNKDPVRLFIGSSSNGEDHDAEVAYVHSVRKNLRADRECVVNWMRQTYDDTSPWSGWATERWSTPFSGFRWGIPEVCSFAGRAIYTDVDMINYRDISELADVDLKGKPFGARRGVRFGGHEFCVMVIDCKASEFLIPPLHRARANPDFHHRMISAFSGNSKYVEDLDPRWNCLDGEDRPLEDIWQLHFTNMATQPWKPAWYTGETKEHPRPDVVDAWVAAVNEAHSDGVYEYEHKEPITYNIIGR